MVKALMSLMGLLFAVNVQASPTSAIEAAVAAQTAVVQQANFTGIDWKVGDTAVYDLTMAIIVKGTMTMSIASIEADGIWMHQDIEIYGNKQQMQILIDSSTGQTKKIIVNGQEQTAPKQDIEVVDTVEEKITVPAGTFDAMHITARNKASAKNNEINIWMNPQAVPVGGTLKQIAPTAIGKMTTVLKSFIKN